MDQNLIKEYAIKIQAKSAEWERESFLFPKKIKLALSKFMYLILRQCDSDQDIEQTLKREFSKLNVTFSSMDSHIGGNEKRKYYRIICTLQDLTFTLRSSRPQ